MLAHFYHVYADGVWEAPVEEHLHALTVSGLLENPDDVFVGIVGSRENRAAVKERFPAVVIAEADTGWEQLTLLKLHDYAMKHEGKIFYAHTKGAFMPGTLRDEWRQTMTYDTVTRWVDCVEALDSHDMAGSFWMTSDRDEHKNHKSFFGGNFWWANTHYLRSLSRVGTDDRWQAEGWVGLLNPSVKVLRNGLPTAGNFGVPHAVV